MRNQTGFTRRAAIGTTIASPILGLPPLFGLQQEKKHVPRSTLGLVVYCARIRRATLKRNRPDFDLYEPSHFLEHCRSQGAGGMQISLARLEADQARALRRDAEQDGSYIEAIVQAPFEKKDLERFTSELRTAAAAGALAARTTIIPGRRYEFFDSIEKFRKYAARGRRALEMAAPIAEKLRIPLAVENHKDHRNDQRIALFEQISSEYVGACLDTGNSFALLEDPLETVKRFLPWVHSVHLKDQALQRTDDGFLLGDIPLGQGGLDLKQMVELILSKNANTRFTLELITRDPLRVPCLEAGYWTTMRDVPARELARTLRYVRDHSTDNLQYISAMSDSDQLAREDANVEQSLSFARTELGLVSP